MYQVTKYKILHQNVFLSFLVFISGAAKMLKFMDADSNGKYQ